MTNTYKITLLILVLSLYPFCYFIIPQTTINLAHNVPQNKIEYVVPKNWPNGKLRKELAYEVKDENNHKYEKFYRGNIIILEIEAVDLSSNGKWDYFFATIFDSNGSPCALYRNRYGLDFSHFNKNHMNSFNFHDNNGDGLFDEIYLMEEHYFEAFKISPTGITPLNDNEILSIKNSLTKPKI